MVIDRIEALIEKATPGPWETRDFFYPASNYEDSDVITSPQFDGQDQDVICEHAGCDAAFIAHARQLLPLMLEVMDAASPWALKREKEPTLGEAQTLSRVFAHLEAYCSEHLPEKKD